MSEGISNASLIAAAFGPGVVRPARPLLGPAYARDPAALQPGMPADYPRPEDRVDIIGATEQPTETTPPAAAYDAQGRPTTTPTDSPNPTSGEGGPANHQLTEEEQQEVVDLQERDREVRRHEQAHVAAGGQYVRGGARLEYETGPDGKRYATGGEVSIDTSEVPDDPAATIRKMQAIRRAALAPAEPSATDQRIAAEARTKENAARLELQGQDNEKTDEPAGPTPDSKSVETATGTDQSPKPAAGDVTSETNTEDPSGVKAIFEQSRAGRAMDRSDQATPPPADHEMDVPRIRPPGPRYASLDNLGGVLDLVA
jgi:hypothetical protein